MKTESEFAEAYQDFMRKRGIPHTLRRDNAKTETSEKVLNLHRDFVVADEYTEPHSPWQNPAEGGGVRFLKSHAEVLMNRSGCPDYLWFACHEYICAVHECCANEHLNLGDIPYRNQGRAHQIFHMLCNFIGMNLVLYYNPGIHLTPKPRRSQDILWVSAKMSAML